MLTHLGIKSHSKSSFSFFALVHDFVVQCTCFQKSVYVLCVGGLLLLDYVLMELPVQYILASWTAIHDQSALFPLSHQQKRCPFVSITLHFLFALIQTRESQLCLIAGKLHSTHMAVIVHVPGKSC